MFACSQLVWNKSKELFFAGPTTIFPGLDNKPASHLTPTEDAFKQHVLRARYQTNI
jgi:hypothetical protein